MSSRLSEEDFHPVPFWSLNDELEDRELIRQIRWMKNRGYGGFFMHSRIGLIVPYLSREWMEKVRLCVREARRLGMKAWLYDEDRWPSGMAGGLVAAQREKYYNRQLVLTRGTGGRPGFEVVLEKPHPNFNNRPYVDLLNPETVDRFIESTYEAYRRELGAEFGRTIPGIFTDEPTFFNFWLHLDEISVPWTERLPELFRRKYGYSLEPRRRLLFFPGRGCERVRYDFWRLVSELFASAYSERLGRWCRKHGLILTGHLLGEETILSQIRNAGAPMLHYPHYGVPGVDTLFNELTSEICARQCASVARQFDKKRILSETYGGAGWKLTLEEMRWIFDWQAVLGVNFSCPHVVTFSLRGCRKRDWPPYLSARQPVEKCFSALNAHITRVSRTINQGKPVREILVIHPLAAGWRKYSPRDSKAVEKLDQDFLRLSRNLSGLKRGYDYADEILLERHGRIVGKELAVGKARYRLVLALRGEFVTGTTRRLLKKFTAAGGKVVFVRPGREELKAILDRLLPADLNVSGDNGKVYLHARATGRDRIYFLFNTDRKRSFSTVLEKEGRKRPLEFLPMQSHVVGFRQGRFAVLTPEGIDGEKIPLPGNWRVENLDSNVLVLDRCSLKIGDKPWSKTMPVGQAHDEVCRYFSIPSNRKFNRYQPWLRPQRKDILGRIALRFSFEAAEAVKDISLAVESIGDFNVSVNGKTIPGKSRGYFLDPAWGKIPVGKYLRMGRNEIILDCPRYREELELENAYLVGDFQVRNLRLCGKAGLRLGDWTKQGYPFYAGRMKYETGFNLTEKRPLWLELEKFSGMAVRVDVNGREAGVIWTQPYQVEITKLVKKGKNRLTLIVYSTLRNLLGPLHHRGGEPRRIWSFAFSDEANWTDRYQLVPQGLDGKVSLVGGRV